MKKQLHQIFQPYKWNECDSKLQVNLGDNLKTFIATTTTNNMCESPISGLEDSTDKKVIKFLKDSSFYKIKRESEYLLSLKGVCGWGLLPDANNSNIMVVLDITFFTDKDIWGVIDNTEHFGGFNVNTSIWVRYFFKGKRPFAQIYEIGYQASEIETNLLKGLDMNSEEFTKEIEFTNLNVLPCKIISNTFAFKSDIANVSEGNFELLNKLSNQSNEIWEYNKQMWINNSMTGGNKSREALKKAFVKGRFIENNSLNADGSAPFLPFTAPNSNELMLQSGLISIIKDSILQMCYCMREVISGSTNKHNLENIKIDENALSHLKNKLSIREHQYNEFFSDIVKLDVNVSMNVNLLSQYKFEATDPALIPNIQLQGVKVKAKNVLDTVELKAKIAKEVLAAQPDVVPQETIQEKVTV